MLIIAINKQLNTNQTKFLITAFLESNGYFSQSQTIQHEVIFNPKVNEKNRIPSPHGGRGALPSEGGCPSDVLFLAGGGFDFLCSLSKPFLFPVFEF